eukprot:403331600
MHYLGKYALRAILYPYANYFIRQKLNSQINEKFSKDFAKLIEELIFIIKIMSDLEEIESYKNISSIIGKQDNLQDTEVLRKQIEDKQQKLLNKYQQLGEDQGDEIQEGKNNPESKLGGINQDSSRKQSPSKKQTDEESIRKESKEYQRLQSEINTKMFTIIELISLYSETNTAIIKNQKEHTSQEFRQSTDILLGLKENLEKLPILPISFKKGSSSQRSQSVWNFYRKDLLSDRDLERTHKIIMPKIMQNDEAFQIIIVIDRLTRQFRQVVNRATKIRCGLFCRYNKMFGTLSQNQLLLNKNFEGQNFEIEGYNGAKLDCMFFPCTSEQNLEISLDNPVGEFLGKPTFIMCNPNALIYQQMINSPNSYWLSFFLKRGINVLCWNYRDYGFSRKSWYSASISPYNVKIDAEKIMDFLLNKMKLRGKIGVYGRSIGGIASTHLANKFSEIVEAIIIDRTLNELDDLAIRRLTGRFTKYVYKFVSCQWKALNDVNTIEAKCFKIIATDTKDDVVENFSSLPVGIAQKLAKNTYKERKWHKFYECLCLIYDLEDILYKKLTENQQLELSYRLLQTFKDTTTAMRSNRESHEAQNQSNRLISSFDEEKQILIRTQNSISSTLNLQSQLVLNYIKTQVSQLQNIQELHQQIYTLMICLDDLIAGCVPLKDLLNLSRTRSIQDFRIFLQVLEVYGVGYNDDIERTKYSQRATLSHSQQAIDQLHELVQSFHRQIWCIKEMNTEIFNQNQSLKNSIQTFLQFQVECLQDLIVIQSQKDQRFDNDFTQIKEGHMVLMKCGHRGKPSRMEEKRISRLLRKSGFIPMLEDLHHQNLSPEASTHPKYIKLVSNSVKQNLSNKFQENSYSENIEVSSSKKHANKLSLKNEKMTISNLQQQIQSEEHQQIHKHRVNESGSLAQKISQGTFQSNHKDQKNQINSNLNDENLTDLSSSERVTLQSLRKKTLQNINQNHQSNNLNQGFNTQQSDDEYQSKFGANRKEKLNSITENGFGQISDTNQIIGSLPLD